MMRSLRLRYGVLVLGAVMAISSCGTLNTQGSGDQTKEGVLKDGINAVLGSVDRRREDFRKHTIYGSSNKVDPSEQGDDHDLPGPIITPDYSGIDGSFDYSQMYGSLYSGKESSSHEPQYSYDGLVITIDGVEINFADVAPAVNAISDVKRVGDWLIFEGHINPNKSIYGFYNVNKVPTPEFDMEIEGTNLIWQEDDLSTAVYENGNVIYDLWGYEIGSLDSGEISSISFKDSETILVSYNMAGNGENGTGAELELTYRPRDKAVLAYYEFLLGGRGQWYDFAQLAHEDALLYVIVNPPKAVQDKMIVKLGLEENAADALAIIGLKDFQQIHIEKSDYDETLNRMNAIGMSSIGMSEAILYYMNIPSEDPRYTVFVKAGKDGRANWDILKPSGDGDRMGIFISAGK